MKKIITSVLAVLLLTHCSHFAAQRQTLLRDTITPERAWWDLLHYRLAVEFIPKEKAIKGNNEIRFRALNAGQRMQIDLQPPLAITEVAHQGTPLVFTR